MVNTTWSAPPSILAFLTTMHLAMVVLRAHRSHVGSAFSFVTLVSLLFAGSPWLMPSVLGLVAGFAAHGAWFSACERLLPASPAVVAQRPVAVASPAQSGTGVALAARRVSRSPAPRPNQFVQTPVMAVFDETPDIRTFRMARPEGFEFTAGQFLAVRVRADGKEHVRCYSISSPPGARGHLEISVKRLGLVSGALHATIRPGAMLSVRPPAGSFLYPGGEDRPLVLIAGGVGITPLISMLRHAIDAEPTRPVTLYYSARTVEQIAFREELLLLARRHAQLRVFFTVTDGSLGHGHFPGVITDALLTTTTPDIPHAVCLICGPQPMLEAMTALLQAIGVPKPQIRHEIFQAAIAAGGGAAEPVPVATGTHEVQFERSGIATSVEGEQTILEAAEACGADVPALCRAGVCGTCRTRVTAGEVRCASRMLAEDDRRNGFVLPCVTHVLTDCTVDA